MRPSQTDTLPSVPSDFGRTFGYRVIVESGRPILMMGARRDWRGLEHFPRDRGFLVVSNHITVLDPPMLVHYLVANRLPPYFMAKEALFHAKVFGPLMRSAEQIPVSRGTAAAGECVQGAVDAIHEGKVVVIYPEGTTTTDPDLWPMVAKTGAARIALETGCPVIPVGIWGTQKILPRGTVVPDFLRRHTVHLLAGPPVDLADLAGRADEPAAQVAATDRMMRDITALVEELRGEPCPHPVTAA